MTIEGDASPEVTLTPAQLRNVLAGAYSQGAYDITNGKWGSFDAESVEWAKVRADELRSEMYDDYPGCQRSDDCTDGETLHHPECAGGESQ